ncbi:hypothetical protein ACOMHN_007467 [Nucella lapillus]
MKRDGGLPAVGQVDRRWCNTHTHGQQDKSRCGSLYKQYAQQDMDTAVLLVHQGLSAPQAAQKCSVPTRSLYYKLSKCPKHHGNCRGTHRDEDMSL